MIPIQTNNLHFGLASGSEINQTSSQKLKFVSMEDCLLKQQELGLSFSQLEYSACPSEVNLEFTYKIFLMNNNYAVPRDLRYDVDFFHNSKEWKYFNEFVKSKYYLLLKVIENNMGFTQFML